MSQKTYCSACPKEATRFCQTCGKNFCGRCYGTHEHPSGSGAGIG